MNKLRSFLLLKSNTSNSRAGFTLVEILLVVAILGILAGVAVTKLSGRTKAASIAATRTSISAVGTAIDAYEVDNGIYPQSLLNLQTKGNENNWNGPYMKSPPKDAWGNDFSYSVQGDSYKLISAGPDGQAGSSDDISN